MKLNTALGIAVAAALAVPFAAQASAQADRIIVAQAGSTMQPKDSNPAAPPATSRGDFSALDKNADGHLSRDEAKDTTWSNRFTELDKDNDGRLSQSEYDAMQAGSGATGATGTTGTTGSAGAPITGGSNSADRKPSTPKQ